MTDRAGLIVFDDDGSLVDGGFIASRIVLDALAEVGLPLVQTSLRS